MSYPVARPTLDLTSHGTSDRIMFSQEERSKGLLQRTPERLVFRGSVSREVEE
jgi:hypothetical protein